MRDALLIAGKDLRRRLRDRSAYIVGIIAPLGLAAIFSFVFNPISDSSFTGTFGVVNNDGGQVAAMFVDQVLGGLADSQKGVTIVSVESEADARARVEAGGDPASNATNGLSAACPRSVCTGCFRTDPHAYPAANALTAHSGWQKALPEAAKRKTSNEIYFA